MTTRSALALVLVLGAILLAGCLPDAQPLAVLSAATTHGPAPLEITFDLSLSRSASGEPLAFRLDFGDGSEPYLGAILEPTVSHVYSEEGTFLAQLMVTDTAGRHAGDALPVSVSASPPPMGLEVGMLAPSFVADTVTGESFTLSESRGSVVLLDFWGAWCAPCRRSLPHLQGLYDSYGERGLVVVLVSTDESLNVAEQYLTTNGYTDFVCVWEEGGKRANPIVSLYEMTDKGIPRTFVLDRQGIIRYVGHPDHLSGDAIETLL
ncbi:MAG: redoxin domain-containing protein [Candidatus Bipolaricaulota bacterium]|nr:MAG: redoxin domain-containing protein [Candidatus Bipolaricaulota bacterium]